MCTCIIVHKRKVHTSNTQYRSALNCVLVSVRFQFFHPANYNPHHCRSNLVWINFLTILESALAFRISPNWLFESGWKLKQDSPEKSTGAHWVSVQSTCALAHHKRRARFPRRRAGTLNGLRAWRWTSSHLILEVLESQSFYLLWSCNLGLSSCSIMQQMILSMGSDPISSSVTSKITHSCELERPPRRALSISSTLKDNMTRRSKSRTLIKTTVQHNKNKRKVISNKLNCLPYKNQCVTFFAACFKISSMKL